MIYECSLPFKEGYIEVELEGVRQYQKVVTASDLENQDRDKYLIDLEYRLTMIELGV